MQHLRVSRYLLLAVAVPAIALAFAGCGKSDHSAPPTRAPGVLSFVVRVSDNVFTPANLTVPPGTSITWEWSGSNKHSLVGTFADLDVRSPEHQGHGDFSLTIGSSGTWHYHCGVHGNAMSGTITVN
jgi:plastocyanin